MRVLIVNRALGTLFGGGETFDSGAARHLARAGHDVKLLGGVPLSGKPTTILNDLDVTYIRVPNIRRLAYNAQRYNNRASAAFYYLDLALFERAAIRWLAADHRDFDVVQVCGLFDLAEEILGRWGVPTVAWLPGVPSKRVQKKIKALAGVHGFRLFSRGDPVRFVKDTMGVDIATIEPGLDIETIDVSAPGVRETLGLPLDAVVGVTVARLVPVKNIAFLLDGLAVAKRRTPALYHWVIGDGPLRAELEQRARSLGLGSFVRFIGEKDRRAVHRYLAESDFFVLPSRYENFSNAVLEAMAHGLPVISTEVGYVQHIVRESGAGVTVSLGDVDALATALETMATRAEVRQQYAGRARDFVARFAWPKIVAKLVATYEDARESRNVV